MSYKYPSKTKLCKWILKGKECPRGSDCTFAHKNSELQHKNKSPISQIPPPPPPHPPLQSQFFLPPPPPPSPINTTVKRLTRIHLCVRKNDAQRALQEAIDSGYLDIHISIIEKWCDVEDDVKE